MHVFDPGLRRERTVLYRNPNDDISFEATFAEGTEIVRRDGTRTKASLYAGYFWLDPGDAAIFAAPEVGARSRR